MTFLKKIFSKTPKNEINATSNTALSEGDIFYVYSNEQFHIYKLLKIDNFAFHVLCYKSQANLPEADKIAQLEVQVYHFPIAKNGFTDPKILTKSIITEHDLIGYYEYLRQTGSFEEIVEKAKSYYKEAYELTDEDRHIEAIEKYSMAIDLVPEFYEAIDNRAFCKMDLGRWLEAIDDFRLSLNVNPESLRAEFSIGECFLRLGENQLAKKQFEKALLIEPTHQLSLAFLKKTNELLSST